MDYHFKAIFLKKLLQVTPKSEGLARFLRNTIGKLTVASAETSLMKDS